jgi:hypothetical protein
MSESDRMRRASPSLCEAHGTPAGYRADSAIRCQGTQRLRSDVVLGDGCSAFWPFRLAAGIEARRADKTTGGSGSGRRDGCHGTSVVPCQRTCRLTGILSFEMSLVSPVVRRLMLKAAAPAVTAIAAWPISAVSPAGAPWRTRWSVGDTSADHVKPRPRSRAP